MIINFFHDGDICEYSSLLKQGFVLDMQTDIINNMSFEYTEQSLPRFNFVGFLTNEQEDILAIFPKNYRVENVIKDSKNLFTIIQKHIQKHPEKYIGDNPNNKYLSNYPFASFFIIYNYYMQYGLYYQKRNRVNTKCDGKIDWKTTIKNTKFYINKGKLLLFPFYYSKEENLNTFITSSMIYAIDYTIDKFYYFLNCKKTGEEFPEFDFLQNKQIIIDVLTQAKERTFQDNTIQLLDALINFFESINIGGNYYLKSFVFEYIWEDIVLEYLKEHFVRYDDDKLIFDINSNVNKNFKKGVFHPNLANKTHTIEPDFYYIDENAQYIFDAKYKKKTKELDYKQICYCLFLKNKKDIINNAIETYSALILPGDRTYSKLHFLMNPEYSEVNKDIKIIEQYIDIRDVVDWYIQK